ncbi:hypothetical protein SNE40_020889 [Patella caerulea]|uniref:DUF7869 domain-containing protein n=2 Tax=Patella caerulea TaxID=87958 RepID=A0AAN8IYR1_PATCE
MLKPKQFYSRGQLLVHLANSSQAPIIVPQKPTKKTNTSHNFTGSDRCMGPSSPIEASCSGLPLVSTPATDCRLREEDISKDLYQPIDISIIKDLLMPDNEEEDTTDIVLEQHTTNPIVFPVQTGEKSRSSSTESMEIDEDDVVRDPDWIPEDRHSNTDGETDVFAPEKERASVPEQDGKHSYEPPREKGGDKRVERILQEVEDMGETIRVEREEIVEGTDVVNEPVRKRARKGKADPSQWRKTVNKMNRMHGKKFQSTKRNEYGYSTLQKDERMVKPKQCSKRCKPGKLCSSFSEDDRQNIFDMFWKLDWTAKRMFIVDMVDKVPVKERKVTPTTTKPRRNQSLVYNFRKNGVRFKVCKTMFLTTLCLGERSLYNWLDGNDGHTNNPVSNEHSISDGEHTSDRRAQRTVSQKVQAAKSYLESLPSLPSHYCRASSSKQYLEPVFADMTEVYKAYTQYCEENNTSRVSRRTFIDLFHDLNLAIYTPKKDQCDLCCGYQAGNVQEDKYKAHIKRKDDARNQKDSDKERAMIDSTVKVITLDLQAVLLAPNLKASAMYYKTKLGCHNYTVYDLATKECVCYFWHEGEGELTANSFASCLHDYIETVLEKSPNTKQIIIYSDGCTYQNRNVVLANMLLKVASDKNITITQKILEKGHTQMEVDSVHSVIERKIKKRPIYSPQNYIDIITSCKKSYKVYYLSHTFFKEFSSLKTITSIRPGRVTGDPVVTDIRVLKYSPDGSITYKLDYNDEFGDLPRRSRSTSDVSSDENTVPQLYPEPLPIKTSKYRHLQELKSVIPVDYHGFYDGLAHA